MSIPLLDEAPIRCYIFIKMKSFVSVYASEMKILQVSGIAGNFVILWMKVRFV